MSYDDGLITGLLLGSGGGSGGSDEPAYLNDPDWELFKNAPEPASNQLVLGIRVVDPTFRKAGTYYKEYELRDDFYYPVYETEVKCNVAIDPGDLFRVDPTDSESSIIYPSYTIDWGDGTVTSFAGGTDVSTADVGADGFCGGENTTNCHLYTEAGTYIVVCTFSLMQGDYARGSIGIRVHDKNSAYQYVNGAPITVFAKVGDGFSCSFVNTAPFSQIMSLGMSYSIKFLSGNFAKLSYPGNIFSSLSCLKYLKTDAVRCICETYNGEKYATDPALNEANCLEKIEITGKTYSGQCKGISSNGQIIYQMNFYTTNEIASDDEFPIFKCNFLNCYQLKKIPSQFLQAREYYVYNDDGYHSVFEGCKSLKSINLPNCESLPRFAFYNCISLEKVSLPKLKTIPYNCFGICSSLKEISAPECTIIDNYAFNGCCALPEFSFEKCESVSSSAIPSGNNSNYWYGLKKISLPRCTEISFSCGRNDGLLEVDCPSCTSLTGTFYSCKSLYKVILAENCTFNGSPFSGCLSLFPRPDGSVH